MLRLRLSGWGSGLVSAMAALTITCGATGASAETLESALVQAYQNNPTLNSQRASVRATDEGVPQALSGYRPRVSLSASVGEAYIESTTKSTSATGVVTYPSTRGSNAIQTYGGTITQTLLNGNGTASRTRQAE